MAKQPQDTDRPGNPMRSKPNTSSQRDSKVREGELGDDRLSGDEDEALPEGEDATTLDRSEQSNERRPGERPEEPETSDRRGDGSESPSNVRRERGRS